MVICGEMPDSTLGSVLANALRRYLGESSVVAVMPRGRVESALVRMRRPPGTRLRPAVAREVAQREGARAVVEGDLAQLGGGYLVTLRLVHAATGDELASFPATAARPETDLIPALEKLGRALRSGNESRGAMVAALAGIARARGRLSEAHRLDANTDSIDADFLRAARFGPVFDRPVSLAAEELWLRGNPSQAIARLDEVFTAHPVKNAESDSGPDGCRSGGCTLRRRRQARSRAANH